MHRRVVNTGDSKLLGYSSGGFLMLQLSRSARYKPIMFNEVCQNIKGTYLLEMRVYQLICQRTYVAPGKIEVGLARLLT